MFHVWTYAHFPLYLGIVATGVGLQRIVESAARHELPASETGLLTGAAVVMMSAMDLVGATSSGRADSPLIRRSTGLAATTMAGLILLGRFQSPVPLIVVVALTCVALVVSSLSVATAPPASP
jgi:low temperature requirement protein LtrA